MNKTKLQLIAVLTFCLPLMPAALAASPDMIAQLPADAQLIVATRSLNELNTRVSGLVNQLGLPLPDTQPGSVDILAKIGEETGLGGHLDASRGMALIVGDFMQGEQTMSVMIPVKDAKSTLNALDAQKHTSMTDTWVVDSLDSIVSPMGKYLLIAPAGGNFQYFKNAGKGAKLNTIDSKLFADSDIAVSVNLKTIMPMARGLISMQLMGQPKVAQNPTAMQAINVGLDRVAEIAGVSFGLSFVSNGLSYDLNVHTVDDSMLSSALTGHPAADMKSLSKVPDGTLATATVAKLDGSKFAPILESLLNILAGDAALTEKIGADTIAAIRELVNMKMTQEGVQASYASAAGTPGAAGGQNIIGYSRYSESVDALIAKGKALTPKISEIMTQFGLPLKMEYVADAGKTNGLSYDLIKVDMSGLADLTPQMRQQLTSQWGPEMTMNELICKLDDHTLIYSVGSGNLEKIVSHAKSGGAGLDKNAGIQSVHKELPANASVYTYYHVGNALRQQLSTMPPQVMMMAGMLTQIQGVIGTAVTMDQGSLQISAHVPRETITSAGKAIAPFMMMMQGGPAGASVQ